MNLISPNSPIPHPFPKGAVLLFNKPLMWTSFDVVNKIRHILSRYTGQKKLKVGHAGTLDPLATGLLVLCVGEDTKRIKELQAMPKTYEGTMTFGATTPSFDLEKKPDSFYPTGHLNIHVLEAVKTQFLGDILQVPPVFSAVKVGGRRLYKNARTGEDAQLPHRAVYIQSFEWLGELRHLQSASPPLIIENKKGSPIAMNPDYADGLQIDFRVVCSKGTYIRSLVHDIGQAVGSGAYLSRLCRTASGGFSLESAWEIEAFVEKISVV